MATGCRSLPEAFDNKSFPLLPQQQILQRFRANTVRSRLLQADLSAHSKMPDGTGGPLRQNAQGTRKSKRLLVRQSAEGMLAFPRPCHLKEKLSTEVVENRQEKPRRAEAHLQRHQQSDLIHVQKEFPER